MADVTTGLLSINTVSVVPVPRNNDVVKILPLILPLDVIAPQVMELVPQEKVPLDVIAPQVMELVPVDNVPFTVAELSVEFPAVNDEETVS